MLDVNFGNGNPPRLILQSRLERLQSLRRLRTEENELRDEIKMLLKAGVLVEQGRLMAELRPTEYRNITEYKLRELYGPEWVAQVKRLIRPKVVEQVRVREASATVPPLPDQMLDFGWGARSTGGRRRER